MKGREYEKARGRVEITVGGSVCAHYVWNEKSKAKCGHVHVYINVSYREGGVCLITFYNK